MKHLHKIFDKLNLTKEKGLFFFEENRWRGLFTNRIERLLENIIQPDAFFCIDNKPFILFFENPENKNQKLKEIWNFNESPVIFISTEDSLEIYNGFEYLEQQETLRLFGNEEVLNDFTYFKLVTGETWEKYQNNLSYQNRVDYHLLHNIKAARDLLIDEKNSFPISHETANALLGKVIFVRYLIDRNVKLDFEQRGRSREWTNQEFCALLLNRDQVVRFFSYLKEKFNGDLFPLTNRELEAIPQESFVTIINLLSGNEITSGQISLFNLYDFSIIPVEFISNVYELFIGKDQQETKGAYYTPLFLVDYILSQTVEKKFRENKNDYTCRVLDPSCGSGIFLVETLRKIIEQFRINNPDLKNGTTKYRSALKQLAIENLFGIDKDRSAVDVAIFSIYLTLLDYQKPSDVETFKFPLLFGKNFFSYDFFDTEAEFNNVFSGIEFDIILGNPPWKGNGIGKKGTNYLISRLYKESDKRYPIGINNGEIVEGFILRASDFAKPQTKIAFVIRSTILYNKGYSEQSKFRKYLLEEYFIDKLLELAPVRFEVFDKSNDPSIAPAAIIFYRYAYGNNTDNNVVEHITLKPSRFFSLFKVFTIYRSDYKKVQQRKLKLYDWLWKTLVYGSYFDFNFIRRIRENFNSLKLILSDLQNFKKGTGVKFSQKPEEDSSNLVGKPFISAEYIEPLYIPIDKTTIFEEYKVGRKRNSDLFKGPVLLVRNGLDTRFLQLRAAIFESDVVYKNSVTGIRPTTTFAEKKLKNVLANLYSDLYPYLAIHTFCSIGIEREQTKEYEKFDIPYVGDGMEDIVDVIIKLKKEIYQEAQSTLIDKTRLNLLEKGIQKNFQKINNRIFHDLGIEDNGLEACLIDYSLTVLRPLITRDRQALPKQIFAAIPFKEQYLTSYIDVFLSIFNEIYEKLNQKLVVEIKHTNQIIGVFFKLSPSTEDMSPITWVKSENSGIIQLLISIGTEKITDRLFVQKDIRGFEEDGFYIIKPNEKKLWHRAIAHLDVNEFMDAVLVAGKKSVMDVQ